MIRVSFRVLDRSPLAPRTFGSPRILVTDNGDAFDRPTSLKVRQQLLRCRSVVHLPHIDRTPVLGRLIFRAAGCRRCLFLFELFGFLRDAGCFFLHAGNLGLKLFEVFFLFREVVVFLFGGHGGGDKQQTGDKQQIGYNNKDCGCYYEQ